MESIKNRTLKRGMRGKDVTEIQELLIALGHMNQDQPVSGVFNLQTEQAIKSYQDSVGFTPNGIVDSSTKYSLCAAKERIRKTCFTPSGLMAEFIGYLQKQVDNRSIYVWGAQGETGAQITEAWIRRKEEKKTNQERVLRYWKKQIKAGYGDILSAFDCSGLGMYFISDLHGLCEDCSSDSMRGLCVEIGKEDLRTGDWVFGKGHVGYIIDNQKNVIHAKGRDSGVVKEALNANGDDYWIWFGRPQIFDNVQQSNKERDLFITTPLLFGSDVNSLQAKLATLGYSVGKIDGIYGNKTDAALRLFQERAKHLTEGVCDNAMRILLGL